MRAEGESEWFTASHDEFALAMDGEIEIHFHKAVGDEIVPESVDGTQKRRLTRRTARRWAMSSCVAAIKRSCRREASTSIAARKLGVIMLQTILGDNSVQKWAEICYV